MHGMAELLRIMAAAHQGTIRITLTLHTRR